MSYGGGGYYPQSGYGGGYSNDNRGYAEEGNFGGGFAGGFGGPGGPGGGAGFAPPAGPPPGAGGGGFYGAEAQGGYGGPPHHQHHHQGGYGGGYGNEGAGGFAPPAGPPPGFGGNAGNAGGHSGYGGGGGGGGFAPPSGPPPGWGQRVDGPIGPAEYQTNNAKFDRPTGQKMENGMHYEYSSMNGKRKALLIGINYIGSQAALRGCINDVHSVKQFIMSRGYKEEDMVILTDDQQNPRNKPTRSNMTAAMHWLVQGAQPGDALFLHYSGHGGQEEAAQGDENDGMNETIIPLDYQQAGMMADDELHQILVRPLPVGCRLTAVFDSCHSGTVLDLPYVYATSGKIKEPNVLASVGKGMLSAAMDYARGDMTSVVKGLFSTAMSAKNTKGAEKVTKETRSSGADVVMLSGCKDSQTSADAVEASKATGAASWALIKVLKEHQQLTYSQLLNCVRDALVSKYQQKPQLSSSHPIDLDLIFTI